MRGLTFIYYSPVFLAQYAMPLVCDHLKEGVRVNLIEVGDTGFLVPIPGISETWYQIIEYFAPPLLVINNIKFKTRAP